MHAYKPVTTNLTSSTAAIRFGYLLCVVVGNANYSFAADVLGLSSLKPCGRIYGPSISTQTFTLPPADTETEVEVGQSMVATFKTDVMIGPLILNRELTFTGNYLQDFDVTVPAGALQPVGGSSDYRPSAFTFQYRNESTPRGSTFRPAPELTLRANNFDNTLVAHLNFGMIKRSVPIATFDGQIENCSLGVC